MTCITTTRSHARVHIKCEPRRGVSCRGPSLKKSGARHHRRGPRLIARNADLYRAAADSPALQAASPAL